MPFSIVSLLAALLEKDRRFLLSNSAVSTSRFGGWPLSGLAAKMACRGSLLVD